MAVNLAIAFSQHAFSGGTRDPLRRLREGKSQSRRHKALRVTAGLRRQGGQERGREAGTDSGSEVAR